MCHVCFAVASRPCCHVRFQKKGEKEEEPALAMEWNRGQSLHSGVAALHSMTSLTSKSDLSSAAENTPVSISTSLTPASQHWSPSPDIAISTEGQERSPNLDGGDVPIAPSPGFSMSSMAATPVHALSPPLVSEHWPYTASPQDRVGSSILTHERAALPVPVQDPPKIAQAESPDLCSPIAPSEQELPDEPELIKGCLFLWVVSLASVGTFMIPTGLILLSYFASMSTNTAHFTISTGHQSTTPLAPYQRSSTQKYNPWQGIPANCLGNVTISDYVSLNATTIDNRNLINAQQFNFFCIYNNSRSEKNFAYDYLPKHMPFGLCPNVIYWSMGLRDGKVTSRMPRFDQTYGIEQLRKVVTDQGYPNTKIIMTMGGYAEDSQDFSRLGRDPVSMSTLVADVLANTVRHTLNGIAIHWIQSSALCSRPDDTLTLVKLVENLKVIFQLNGLSMLITLILPADRILLDRLLPIFGDAVDFFFLTTHLQLPRTMNLVDCHSSRSFVVNELTAITGYNTYQQKICISSSMSAILFQMNANIAGPVVTPHYSPPSPYSRLYGRASLVEVCPLPFHKLRRSSCILRETIPTGIPGRRIVNVLMFEEPAAIYDSLHIGYAPTRGSFARCAVVYDIDLDNFNHGCYVIQERYIRLRDFYESAASRSYVSFLGQ